MRIWRIGRGLVLLALVGAGCGSADRPENKGASAAVTQSVSTAQTQAVQQADAGGKPQPKLRTLKLWLGAEELISEIAMSEREITNGMMFRTEMAENEGMLFVFSRPHRASFWMKNTLLPLSCAYIDPDGVILELRDMKPKDETPLVAATERVQYVLEVNQGWFERRNIKVGNAVRTERGTLMETFFVRR